MGVVAPLASVVGVIVPVLAGLVVGERPSTLAVAGIVVGLVAITVVAAGGVKEAGTRGVTVAGPLLGLLAGLAFGIFFVALDLTPPGSGLWPLVAGRLVSVPLLGLIVALAGQQLPRRPAVPMVALSGGLDMLANILFLLATRAGLLTISALLASLYPVVVVVLARQLLAERLRGPQIVAVVLALLAVAVITVA
jgi:drug/metabolite transporter (DMT)-like permease